MMYELLIIFVYLVFYSKVLERLETNISKYESPTFGFYLSAFVKTPVLIFKMLKTKETK